MTPIEFKEARKKLKKTQFDMAIQIGVSVRTVKRYEAGETVVPLSIELLLRDVKRGDNAIVAGMDYHSLEEVINSHDKCLCAEVEIEMGSRHIIIFACDIDGENIVVTEYMKGDSIYSSGRYMEAGSWFGVEGKVFDSQKIVNAFLANYPAKIVEVYIGGIGFDEHMELENDSDSEDKKANI